MKTFTKEEQRRAFEILRDSWGQARTLTAEEFHFLDETWPRELENSTALQMALGIAGLQASYNAASGPMWSDFRAWIAKQEAPK